jgi:hypothetical protein
MNDVSRIYIRAGFKVEAKNFSPTLARRAFISMENVTAYPPLFPRQGIYKETDVTSTRF